MGQISTASRELQGGDQPPSWPRWGVARESSDGMWEPRRPSELGLGPWGSPRAGDRSRAG